MAGKVDSEALAKVLGGFPQWTAAIKELSHGNEEFQELCGDYADCLMAIERFRGDRGVPDADARIEQYCELRVNLEQELLSLLIHKARKSEESIQP